MMQNHTGHVSMDPELQALRINMQDRICKWLERKQTNPSSDWKQRLPDIAKSLEESIFKESHNRDDYLSKFQIGIESRLINMLNQMKQNYQPQQQLHQQQQNHQQTMAHHNIQSNSLVSGMMIPTPGISHNPTGTMRMSSSMDPELQALRINMQDGICKWLERKETNPSSDWKQRLPDIAKMLEESIFKESHNRDDYLRKFQSGIESRMTNMLNQIKQNYQQQQQLHQQQQNHQQTMARHNMQSNSSVSGMIIPTPGISHNPTGTMRMSSSIDPELQALRINMQDRICKWLEREQTNPSSDWKQRLPDIAKRLEESIFNESRNKDDYLSKFQSGIESRITNMLIAMQDRM